MFLQAFGKRNGKKGWDGKVRAGGRDRSARFELWRAFLLVKRFGMEVNSEKIYPDR